MASQAGLSGYALAAFLMAGNARADICRDFLETHPAPRAESDLVASGDFDANGDGRMDHVTAEDFGTAHFAIYHIGEHEMDTPINEEGGGYVGRWYVVNGRGYLVTFASEDEKYIHGLFEVSRGYEFHLLCTFDNIVQRLFFPRRNEDKAICEASDADLPPDPNNGAKHPDTTGWPYANDKSIGPSFPISFDNAGTKAQAAQIVVDFGGGRGCDYDYLVLAGSDGSPAARHQRELLEALQERGDYSLPATGCRNTRFSWFKASGKTYLRSRPASIRVSGAFDDADRVNGVVDGVPRRICQAFYSVTWKLADQAHLQ